MRIGTANLLAAACLLGWIVGGTVGKLFFGEVRWPDSVVDYRILYEQSRKVVEEKEYAGHPIFPYPPSAVALLYGTAQLSFPLAAGLWLGITLVATAGTFALGTGSAGLSNCSCRWLLALVAFSLTEYFIQWDLRSQNCNMVYCFLLVAALAALRSDCTTLSGLLLAASIALKLYPVLIVPYLWLVGRRRAFGATLVFLLVFFVLLPSALFGLDAIAPLYRSWFNQMRIITATSSQSDHPILIAIPHFFARKLGPDSMLATWVMGGLTVVWLGAVAMCLFAGRKERNDERDKGGKKDPGDLRFFADAGILALTPVVISPYLEAYHVVLAIVPILALMKLALDSRESAVIAGVALAAGWLSLRIAGIEMVYRGLGVYVQTSLIVLALAAIRWRQVRTRAVTAPSPLRIAA
jgi:Glycosyltransferase family 87